ITTTYGTVKNGYIISVNRDNIFKSAGKGVLKHWDIRSSFISQFNNNSEIIENGLRTGDVGYIVRTENQEYSEIFIKGRAQRIFTEIDKRSVTLDQIEKIIKGIPF